LETGESEVESMSVWQGLLAARSRRMKASDIREAFKLAERGDIISFAGGFPAAETFPLDEVGAVAEKVAREMGATSLQYGPTEGLYELREMVAQRLEAQGIPCRPEAVLLTNGSQQALDLVAKLFLDPGDGVIVEKPGYIGGISAFGNYEAEYWDIPLDGEGLRTDLLEERLARAAGTGNGLRQAIPKLCYVVPNFQNPTGVTLSEDRRRHLVDLAREHGFLIIEDNPYGEIRFEGMPRRHIKAYDRDGHVLYLGSFSKVAFPGLRVGYVAGPEELVRKLAIAKQGTDLCSTSFGQKLIVECERQGLLDAHLKAIIQVYRRKRDLMISALKAYFPEEVRWTYPEGGFFVWVTLPQWMDAKAMLPRVISEIKVAYVSGAAFFTDGTGKNTIRLAYSQATDEDIVEGVKRLGGFLRREIARGLKETVESRRSPMAALAHESRS
jgi:Transcriptional regulators containing a DNA-binding HTH domain and an aminotransferase domain (MocR family) and their eukaryotic orthologs